jgi:O-antigen/teichoic acid export membrane protein
MADGKTAPAQPHRFGANLRWQFVANAGQAVFGGVFLLVLGRLLGPADFGTFSAIIAVVAVVGLVFDMRLHEVVARDFCLIDQGHWTKPTDRLYLWDLCLLDSAGRLLPCLGLILFSPFWAENIHLADDRAGLITIAAAGFFLSRAGNNISLGLLRVLGRTDLIALCTITDWALRLILVLIVAVSASLTVEQAVWIVTLAGAVINLAQILLAIRELRLVVPDADARGWSPADAIPRLLQARRMIIASIGLSASDLMAKDLDIALLARFLTEDKIGIYKMAKTAVQLLWRAVDPFYLAIMPEVQKLWQNKDFSGLKRLLLKTSLMLAGLACLLVATGCGGAALFATLILGAAYGEIPHLMLVMSPWVIICAPLIWGLPLSVAINRPEFATYGSFLGLIVGLTGFTLLTPLYGLTGAAIAWNLTLISGVMLTGGLAVFFALQHVSGTLKAD